MTDTHLDIEKLSADVRRLEYGPGDKIVVTVPSSVPLAKLVPVLQERLDGEFPDNKVLVMTGGLEIGVLHPSGDVGSPSA